MGANPNSEAAGRPKGEGEALRGNPFPRAPRGQPRSGGGERGEASAAKQKKPALRLACLVDYYDKYSNLLDAICALNIFSSFIEGKQFN
jgi:hypothetical protein